MIGMDFVSFIILLVISIVVSAVLHFVFKYYIRPGINSFISKVIFGWIGAWLGSPVLGHWFVGCCGWCWYWFGIVLQNDCYCYKRQHGQAAQGPDRTWDIELPDLLPPLRSRDLLYLIVELDQSLLDKVIPDDVGPLFSANPHEFVNRTTAV